jgi:hypothetical protein
MGKHIEDTGQHLGRDADASILQGQDGIPPMLFGYEPDVAALGGEPGSVIEQVGDHLSQPGEVSVKEDRTGLDTKGEFLLARLDKRTAGFRGRLQDFREFDSVRTQFQPVGGDATEV